MSMARRRVTGMKRYQVAAVAALGGAMMTATLIVGLGVDGHGPSSDAALRHDVTTVKPGGSAGAGLPGRPSGSSAPAAKGDAAGAGTPTPPAVANASRQPEPPAVQPESVAKVKVTSSGSIAKDKATLKVVTAHTDLTGQRELAWAADAGHPVGDARCT